MADKYMSRRSADPESHRKSSRVYAVERVVSLMAKAGNLHEPA
ncbi:hypothetical protein [Sorangium sp. So ce1024]